MIRRGKIKEQNDDGTFRVKDRGAPGDFAIKTPWGIICKPEDKDCLIVQMDGPHSEEFIIPVNSKEAELEANDLMITTGDCEITLVFKEKEIKMKCEKLTVETKECLIDADKMEIKSDVEITGDVKMTGDMEITGDTKSTGNTDVTGNVEVKGKLKNVALDTHTHPFKGEVAATTAAGVTLAPLPPIG